MNKNFNGKSLSKKYWGIGLDSADKILLDEIISLGKQPEGCFASDEHFAELIEESRVNTNRRIQKLKKQGRIFVTRDRVGKKWRRTIKFISLTENNNLKEIESNDLLQIDTRIESNNLREIESNKLIQPLNQDVTGILYHKETQEKEPEKNLILSSPRTEGEGGKVHLAGPIGINENEVDVLSQIEDNSFDVISQLPIRELRNNKEVQNEEPIPTIPTEISKKLEPTKLIPEFLKKGIWVNEEPFFPLDFTYSSEQMTTSEFKQKRMVGMEIIKSIKKEIKTQENLYKKNKDLITNKDYLSQYKDDLMSLDFQYFIDFLNTLPLNRIQKNLLRPNTEIIKKFSNDIEFYKLAISKTKLKFTVNK